MHQVVSLYRSTIFAEESWWWKKNPSSTVQIRYYTVEYQIYPNIMKWLWGWDAPGTHFGKPWLRPWITFFNYNMCFNAHCPNTKGKPLYLLHKLIGVSKFRHMWSVSLFQIYHIPYMTIKCLDPNSDLHVMLIMCTVFCLCCCRHPCIQPHRRWMLLWAHRGQAHQVVLEQNM